MRYLLLFLLFFCRIGAEEKPMVVVIPSYNNIKWYKKNLDSVLNQKYQNFRVILIDDVLTSGATAGACAQALLRAKAAQVDVLVFARVVAPARVPI